MTDLYCDNLTTINPELHSFPELYQRAAEEVKISDLRKKLDEKMKELKQEEQKQYSLKTGITVIEARDIPDSWYQCISRIQDVGFKYTIQQGSFVGQTRLEFDFVVVKISHPYAEPYDLMLPDIPQHLGIPNPVAPGYVEQYLPYLMTDTIRDDEDYTYGNRLTGYDVLYNQELNQVDFMIKLLKETPNTNQAILQVARPEDCLLHDPPCLRHIDCRVKDGKLWFYPYFRSWDLWGGFPANLAGIAVLQKYMADEIGVEMGPLIASSKGLHVYGYSE